MSEDEFEISAGAEGGKLSVKGDVAARWGNTFADAISPFTNALGALGDVIHAFRTENAIRALSKAQEIARDKGINLQPVPPKFLVKWVECVSLEEPSSDDSDLANLWAGLLVSAAQGLKPGHHYFRRILEDLTFEHYQFLKHFFGGEDGSSFTAEKYATCIRRFKDFFPELEKVMPIESRDRDGVLAQINALNGTGLQVRSAVAHKGSGGINLPIGEEQFWSATAHELIAYEPKHIPTMLKELGILSKTTEQFAFKAPELLADFVGQFPPDNYIVVKVEAYHLTLLGRDFLLACMGETQKQV
ncbi:MAG: hypothetical protein RLO80_13300 [Hyphomonas sp.]